MYHLFSLYSFLIKFFNLLVHAISFNHIENCFVQANYNYPAVKVLFRIYFISNKIMYMGLTKFLKIFFKA